MSTQDPHHHPDHADLGPLLEPLLREACRAPDRAERLGPVDWFRSTWQRGGACTGFADWLPDDGPVLRAMVKFPVGPREHLWTTLLGTDDPALRARLGPAAQRGPTPRVFAAGTQLGPHDLAWLILERLDGGPLSDHLDRAALEHLLAAAADWYARAALALPLNPADHDLLRRAGPVKREDWAALTAKAREAARHDALPEGQRWNHALKLVEKHLPWLAPCWESRPINTWCHGDLHPGNALRRAGATADLPAAPCVLIDLALVHAGHWVEDAVYLERLYWARPELLHGVKPVSALAKARRQRALPTDDDYTRLANVRRVLMAAAAPAFTASEGHPRYLHAALEVIERVLPLLAK